MTLAGLEEEEEEEVELGEEVVAAVALAYSRQGSPHPRRQGVQPTPAVTVEAEVEEVAGTTAESSSS